MISKRLFDVILALVEPIVVSPVWACAAYRIGKENPGLVIYRGKRDGAERR